jgi:diaminopimelate epimerase
MIPFTKAHACGNDFLIVDEEFADGRHAEMSRTLCSRNTGVGADGVEWVVVRDGAITARLINSDGSPAEISGNGTRCVAAWHASETGASEVVIHTGAGSKICRILEGDGRLFQVETAMGGATSSPLTVDGFSGVAVNVGNPHFVLIAAAIPSRWIEIGAALSTDPTFPDGANIEFVRVVDTNSIEFRIYERGAGPTQSSGTGSCAAAVAAMAEQGMPRDLRVMAPGGEQRVRWAPDGVYLTGPAELIARGEAWI